MGLTYKRHWSKFGPHDYMDILRKQQEQFREKYEKMRRDAKERAGKPAADAAK